MLEDHIDRFGEVDNIIDLGFTIADVFEYLEKMKVPNIPKYLTSVHPKDPTQHFISTVPDTTPKETVCSLSNDHIDTTGDIDTLIVSLSGTIIEDCTSPVMGAATVANNKSQ